MATQAQINANRRNAKKSTGPKTQEGKNRSRMNAVVHGRYARVVGWTKEELRVFLDALAAANARVNSRRPFEPISWPLRSAIAYPTSLEALETERVATRSVGERRAHAPRGHE
jgi:hypothetical protein